MQRKVHKTMAMVSTFILALSLVCSSAAASTNEIQQQRSEIRAQQISGLLTDRQVSPIIIEAIEDYAFTNETIDVANVSVVDENCVIFEADQIINEIESMDIGSKEQHKKEVLYFGLPRAGSGEITENEADSRDLITLSTTIEYTIDAEDGIDMITLEKVTGRRLNVGEKVNILKSDMRMAQNGWMRGGYVSDQIEDYDYTDVSSFIASPPASWKPVQRNQNYLVGATYSATIEYADGSTEVISVTNNVP